MENSAVEPETDERAGSRAGTPPAAARCGAFGENAQEGVQRSPRAPGFISNNFFLMLPGRGAEAACQLSSPDPSAPKAVADHPGRRGGDSGDPAPPPATAPSPPLGDRRRCEPPARAAALSLLIAFTRDGVVGVESPGSLESLRWERRGAGGVGRGRAPVTLPVSEIFLNPKVSVAQRGRETPRRCRMRATEPLRTAPSAPAPPNSACSWRRPPPHPVSGRARVLRARCSLPAPAQLTSAPGPVFTGLGAARSPGAPSADTQPAPSALGAGAGSTYMSAGRGPDSRLAADAGAAAAGAAPGRRHPSSGRPGTRAGRGAESAAPPARSARRVHRAGASRPAGSSRGRRRLAAAPTRVRAGAALRRSPPGLGPASRRGSAPWGPPRLGRSPLLPQARQALQPRRPAAAPRHGDRRRPSAAGGRVAPRPPRDPARPPPPQRRRPPRALPAFRSAAAALPAGWSTPPPAHLLPSLAARRTCHFPARPRPCPRGQQPACPGLPSPSRSLAPSRPFKWAFSFIFSHFFLPNRPPSPPTPTRAPLRPVGSLVLLTTLD